MYLIYSRRQRKTRILSHGNRTDAVAARVRCLSAQLSNCMTSADIGVTFSWRVCQEPHASTLVSGTNLSRSGHPWLMETTQPSANLVMISAMSTFVPWPSACADWYWRCYRRRVSRRRNIQDRGGRTVYRFALFCSTLFDWRRYRMVYIVVWQTSLE